MKKYYLVILLPLFCLAMAPVKKTHILFFGDSITEMGAKKDGYIDRIQKHIDSAGLTDSYQLIGAGISGNKIYDLYLRIEEDVLQKQPDVVVIFIGVNDIWHKTKHGTGIDKPKFEKFYQAVIKKLQAQQIKVILCTPAAIGEKYDNSNEQDGDMNEYSKLIRHLAANMKCGLIDLRKIFMDYELVHNKDNKESGILTVDGVHLNEKGNILVAREMMNATGIR